MRCSNTSGFITEQEINRQAEIKKKEMPLFLRAVWIPFVAFWIPLVVFFLAFLFGVKPALEKEKQKDDACGDNNWGLIKSEH